MNRQPYQRTITMLLSLAGCLGLHAAPKPNVLFILVDDLGRQDLGCYGSTFHQTPHIDQLAKESTLFTDAYSASPVCAPTRASILTGKYPTRVGITRATPQRSLAHEELTLAEAMKEHGYLTAHLGKWHLNEKNKEGEKHYPQHMGYDVNVAGHGAGQPASYFYPYQAKTEKYAKNNVPGLESGKVGEYLTDRLTDEAIKLMKDAQDSGRPFFISMWYYSVHTPVQAKPDDIEKFKKRAGEMKLPDRKKEDAIEELGRWHDKTQNDPEYAAMVYCMDENVGRLLKALDDQGIAEDTIVIFTSDNGGLSTGKGKSSPTSNLPLRAGKAWIYEGGIRQPLLIKWSGVNRGGKRVSEPVVSTDYYPTILTMIGAPLKPGQHLDGVDISPLVTGDKNRLDREALYFHAPQSHHLNGMGPCGAVRQGGYKLIEAYESKKVELYNIKDDLGEQNDLSEKQPEKTAELTALLHQWHKDVGAELFIGANKKSNKKTQSIK